MTPNRYSDKVAVEMLTRSSSPACLGAMTVVDSAPRQKVALLWLTTGLGGLIYATIQSFSYLNSYIRAHGAMPAVTFDDSELWIFGISYAVWILPALLAVVSRNGRANWTILIIGGLLVLSNTLGGIFDGIRDGGYIAATAVIAIGLPGMFALRASWRLIRAGN